MLIDRRGQEVDEGFFKITTLGGDPLQMRGTL